MRNRRATILAALAVCTLAGGVSACGGDGPSKAEIEATVNAENAGAKTFYDDATGKAAQEAQKNADLDESEAQEALDRRKKLAALEKEQQEETDRLMKEGVAGGNDDDAEIPIGSADPEVASFRARLAGVCAGGQKRILKVSDQAQDAAKSKDPIKILAAAQAYSLALNDFMAALDRLDAPASVRADYRSWLGTINALADNARLQVVSSGDPEKSKKLAAKTERLFTRLVEKSAALGVTCLSVTDVG